MTRLIARVALLALLAPAPACFHPVYEHLACGLNDACPDGLRCIDHVCGGPQGGIPDAMPAPIPDAGTACDVLDPTIRLCLSFEGVPPVQDLSGAHHVAVDDTGVLPIQGVQGEAIALSSTSKLRFGESPDFDVSALSFDLWMWADQLPASGARRFLFDNQAQYLASHASDGRVQCGISSTLVSSQSAVNPGAWHHVACVYSPLDRVLRLVVDGDVSGCAVVQSGIPTTGVDGLAIGADYSAGDGFRNQFIGKLDSMHLYARALTPDEVCKAAGRTGCATACP